MFKIDDYDINNLNDNSVIRVKIQGYWSGDPIGLYIRRGWDEAPEWRVEMSHSSGGRDTKEVADDLEAETNFGHAMIALAAEGRKILAQQDILERNYQARMAEWREREEADRAAKQKAFDEDLPLGEERAIEMVKKMKEKAQKSGVSELFYTMLTRGNSNEHRIETHCRDKVIFYYVGVRTSTAKLIQILAESSHRTWFLNEDRLA